MRDSRSTPGRPLVVRRMRWDDIPEILRIAGRTAAAPWVRPDFLSVFQSNETVGHTATVGRQVAGFALCSVHRLPDDSERSRAAFLKALLSRLWGEGRPRRRRLELFGLAVAPDRPRAEVERALLDALVRDFGGSAESIHIVVPETSVSAQIFLGGCGFQAIRVFRDHYGREDGYLMRRDGASLPSDDRPGRETGAGHVSADGAGLRRG